MADTLAAGQKAVGVLFGVEMDVAFYVLEPFHRIPRCILQALRCGPTVSLIRLQRFLKIVARRKRLYQSDRILRRERGSRSNREMRRVRRVADENDVVMEPLHVPDP